jgi:hypothetical protein
LQECWWGQQRCTLSVLIYVSHFEILWKTK